MQQGFKPEAAIAFMRGTMLGIRAGIRPNNVPAQAPSGYVFRIAVVSPERPPAHFGSEISLYLPSGEAVLSNAAVGVEAADLTDVMEIGRISLQGLFLGSPVTPIEFTIADVTLGLRSMAEAYYERRDYPSH